MAVIKEQIIRNVKWLSFSVFVTKLLKLISVFWVLTMILPYDYGRFVYLLSLISLCYIFSDLGFSTIFKKEFFSEQGSVEMGTFLLTRLVLSSAGLLISLLLPFFLADINYNFLYVFLVFFCLYITCKRIFIFVYSI